MKVPIFAGLLFSAFFCAELVAQPYDLLIKSGHVIDPANRIDRVMDVAISAGKIAHVAKRISATEAEKVVSASGLYVTPGLIDLHTHVYVGGRPAAVFPDDAVLPNGTTTIVDAGVSGWRTFDDFKPRIIDKSRTRLLAFLNIVGHGMAGTKVEKTVADMDPAATAAKANQPRDTI